MLKKCSKLNPLFKFIVCKGVPPLPPFLKSFFPLPSFLFHPLLRYFRYFPDPHAIPCCPNPTHQPTHNTLKEISEGWFYQLNSCFLSIFKEIVKISSVIPAQLLQRLMILFQHP